jgi:uncharacterized membrane protein YedE/YeeE
METTFTPVASLIGGGLIGLSALMLMALTGRIAGISGIVARILPPGASPGFQGLAFIAGLVVAPVGYMMVTGSFPQQSVSSNLPLLAIAGLMVGFGSVFGSGCTSGHGVCGISRLSPRSMLATATFMACGIVTVSLVRHVFGN